MRDAVAPTHIFDLSTPYCSQHMEPISRLPISPQHTSPKHPLFGHCHKLAAIPFFSHRRYGRVFPPTYGLRITYRDERRATQSATELRDCALRGLCPLRAHSKPYYVSHLCEFGRASGEGYCSVSVRHAEQFSERTQVV